MIAFGRKTANLKFESYNGGRDSKERLTQVGFPIEAVMDIICRFILNLMFPAGYIHGKR